MKYKKNRPITYLPPFPVKQLKRNIPLLCFHWHSFFFLEQVELDYIYLFILYLLCTLFFQRKYSINIIILFENTRVQFDSFSRQQELKGPLKTRPFLFMLNQ